MKNAKQPWQMTRAEWYREYESQSFCNVQQDFTRHSASQQLAKMERRIFLRFGVHDAITERLTLAAKDPKNFPMSSEEAFRLLDIVNTPVGHVDVIRKALKDGLPVPNEVLADYASGPLHEGLYVGLHDDEFELPELPTTSVSQPAASAARLR